MAATTRKISGVTIENPIKNAVIGRLTIFKAQGETNTEDARGPLYTIGYFLDRENAVAAARTKGVFGQDGYVENIDAAVVVYDDPETGMPVVRKLGSVVNHEYEDDDNVRAKALAKLSPKERRALGLK